MNLGLTASTLCICNFAVRMLHFSDNVVPYLQLNNHANLKSNAQGSEGLEKLSAATEKQANNITLAHSLSSKFRLFAQFSVGRVSRSTLRRYLDGFLVDNRINNH